MPKPARNVPAPQKLAREKSIDEAMDAVAQEQARSKISFGLKHRAPFGKNGQVWTASILVPRYGFIESLPRSGKGCSNSSQKKGRKSVC